MGEQDLFDSPERTQQHAILPLRHRLNSIMAFLFLSVPLSCADDPELSPRTKTKRESLHYSERSQAGLRTYAGQSYLESTSGSSGYAYTSDMYADERTGRWHSQSQRHDGLVIEMNGPGYPTYDLPDHQMRVTTPDRKQYEYDVVGGQYRELNR